MENISIQSAPRPRIEYIDAMRGLAMLMVIYCHATTFIFHNQVTGFLVLFERIMLPIFFFISGYLAFNENKVYAARKFLLTKFLSLVLPAIVCFCLYVIVFNRNLINDLFDIFKGGYWFTIVLFEMLAISIFIIKLKEILKFKYITLILFGLIFLSIVLLKVLFWNNLNSNPIIRIFSITNLLHYLPYFCVGIIFKIGSNKIFIDRIFYNRYIQVLLFIVFFGLFYFENSTLRIIQEFIGTVLTFEICSSQAEFFKQNRIGRWFTRIGRYTLQIYFVHYFILFGLFINLAEGIPSTMNMINVPALEFILVGTITFLISESSIIIAKIVGKFPLINSLLFGFKNR